MMDATQCLFVSSDPLSALPRLPLGSPQNSPMKKAPTHSQHHYHNSASPFKTTPQPERPMLGGFQTQMIASAASFSNAAAAYPVKTQQQRSGGGTGDGLQGHIEHVYVGRVSGLCAETIKERLLSLGISVISVVQLDSARPSQLVNRNRSFHSFVINIYSSHGAFTTSVTQTDAWARFMKQGWVTYVLDLPKNTHVEEKQHEEQRVLQFTEKPLNCDINDLQNVELVSLMSGRTICNLPQEGPVTEPIQVELPSNPNPRPLPFSFQANNRPRRSAHQTIIASQTDFMSNRSESFNQSPTKAKKLFRG